MAKLTKEEKTVANQAKRALKKKRLVLVLNFTKENCDGDLELMSAVNALTPGNRVQSTGAKEAVADMFIDIGEAVGENEIWENLKLGRKEMRGICVNLIKKAKTPEERRWIAFDVEEGEYMLMGEGPDAPEGWTGYVPATVDDIEIV